MFYTVQRLSASIQRRLETLTLIGIFCTIPLTALWSQVPVNPRNPAEWEETQALVMEADISRAHPSISWDEAIDPYIKVAEACIRENVNFYCITSDTLYEFATTKPFNLDTVFSNRGIVSPLIHILKVDNMASFTQGPWTRDHGFIPFYENEVGLLKIADFNEVTQVHSLLSTTLGIPSLNIPCSYPATALPAYYDGGNWLSDGHHTFNIANIAPGVPLGLQSPSLADFKDYMGIQKTLNVKGVSIHVDYWFKLIDEERAVVSYIPVENYAQWESYRDYQNDIDASVQAINTHLKSAFGRSLKIYPIRNAPTYNNVSENTTYTTDMASYTNSLILNKSVLVPQYGSQPFDQQALDCYKKLMPGYTITGVKCAQYALRGGAVHCLTHEIPANDPIYLKHAWLNDTVGPEPAYNIRALAKSAKGIAAVKLFWKLSEHTNWQETAMTMAGNHEYTADIPTQALGKTVQYYIAATDNLGKAISKPMVAPAGYYKFYISGNTSVGLKDKEKEPDVKIYPNPAHKTLYVASNKCDGLREDVVTLTDLSGKNLITQPFKCFSVLNVTGLNNGLYILRCKGLSRKVIISH